MPATLPIQFYDLEAEDLDSGNVVEITDTVAEGLNLLIPEYLETPRVQALIASYLKQIQAIETTLFDVWELTLNLDLATTAELDRVGAIVLEPRDNRTDDQYRRALRVRVLVNRSQGRTEDLIKIVVLFDALDSAAAIEAGAYCDVQTVSGAVIEARSVGNPVNARGELHKRLLRAKAAGVLLYTLEHPGGPADSFRFCDYADYPEKDTRQGFSDGPLGAVDGGAFADVQL